MDSDRLNTLFADAVFQGVAIDPPGSAYILIAKVDERPAMITTTLDWPEAIEALALALSAVQYRERACEHCGKMFRPRPVSKRFCSAKCCTKNNNRRYAGTRPEPKREAN